MTTWLVPRAELTPEQLGAVEADPYENRVIVGGPGSGKTMILLHRARYLADRFGIPAEQFRIFVFTNVLAEYIRSALDLLRLPAECVSTFDHWCLEYYEQTIRRTAPRAEHGLDFPAIRRAVLERLLRVPREAPAWTFLLVDEGQDFDVDALAILRLAGRHVTICLDRRQQVYDDGASEPEVLAALGVARRQVTLLEEYRCPPYVAALSVHLAGGSGGSAPDPRRERVAAGEREPPLLFLARDFAEEKARLIEVVKTRQTKGESIAVLLPQRRQVYGFAEGLRESGLEVEVAAQRHRTSKFPPLDFRSDHPKLLTYHSAKGLSFDAVLMPRLVRSSFGAMSDERIEKLVFVGVTRATVWVYLSSSGDGGLPLLQKLESFAGSGFLTVQRGGAASGAAARPEPRPRRDLTDLF